MVIVIVVDDVVVVVDVVIVVVVILSLDLCDIDSKNLAQEQNALKKH